LEAFSKRKNGIRMTSRNKATMAAHERITAVKQLDKYAKTSFTAQRRFS